MTTYEKLKAEHKCVCCWKPLPEGHTKVLCTECRIKDIQRMKKQYYKSKAEHKCVVCNTDLPTNYNFASCYKCRLIQSKRRERTRAKK